VGEEHDLLSVIDGISPKVAPHGATPGAGFTGFVGPGRRRRRTNLEAGDRPLVKLARGRQGEQREGGEQEEGLHVC
jgi:hypothetical protein